MVTITSWAADTKPLGEILFCVCALALPLGHASAFIAKSTRSRSISKAAFYIARGGVRHHVFQSLAAVCFTHWQASNKTSDRVLASRKADTAGWVASLVFHFPSRPALGEDATPSLQRLALSFGVLSVVFFTKAHLTHERFVERASQQLRRHLVFVVGLCAACLALTGTILLLLDPTERFRPRNDVSGDDASGGDTSQARSDYWPVHSSLHMLIKSAPALSGPWHAGPLHYSVALSFFLAAGMSAYGAAGYILHGADNSLGGWNFFQPFKVRLSLHVQVELVGCTSTPPGGAVFIATQCVSWTLFVVTTVGIVHTASAVSAGLLRRSPLLTAALVLAAALSPLSLSASVLAFVDASRESSQSLASSTRGVSERLVAGISATLESDAPFSTAVHSLHTLIARRTKSPPAAAAAVKAPLVAPIVRTKTHPQRSHEARKHAVVSLPLRRSICLLGVEAAKGRIERASYNAARLVLAIFDFVKSQATTNAKAAFLYLNRAACMSVMFLPAHVACVAFALPYAFCPMAWLSQIAMLQATALVVYYFITLRGQPAHSGCRYWPRFVTWMQMYAEDVLTMWLSKCEVHKAFRAPLDPRKRYIFAYMPHGLFPAGAGYCTHLPSWRTAFPAINPHILTANIMHCVPILRDFSGWLGFRQVTKGAFVHALETDRHVLMCPGGQRELLYADEAWPRSEGGKGVVRLCVHHKGFCKIAILTGAGLVPIVCLGELLQLRNAVSWPWLQRFTYRRIGFPLPYFLSGFLGTPLPRRVPVTFIVGPPVFPPRLRPGEEITAEAVSQLHKRFFLSVQDLWNQHKELHADFRNLELAFDGKL